VNAANVDNSYKWAGGGFLSNVSDLVSFGNAMLFSYQAGNALLNTIEIQGITLDEHEEVFEANLQEVMANLLSCNI
jgi:hypothetical protein